MVVSPALQRGERGEQERLSPVGAAQNSKFAVKIASMRVPRRRCKQPHATAAFC
jgi:hypothetical protein